MDWSIVPADVNDATTLAELHVESWRDAYRSILPPDFLAGPIMEDRTHLWQARMIAPQRDRCSVLKAATASAVLGFACVLVDAEPEWGPRLDNLHVRPHLKGLGVGSALFRASQRWVVDVARQELMHLWVLEENHAARQFYGRHGGSVQERQIVEIVAGVFVPELRYSWRFQQAHLDGPHR
jgi:GNAT superfamily N-acetyltransferase